MTTPPGTVAILIERYRFYMDRTPRQIMIDGVGETKEQAAERHQLFLEASTTDLEKAIDHYGEIAWRGEVYRTRTNVRLGRIVRSPFGGEADKLPWPPIVVETIAAAGLPDSGGLGASPPALPEKVAGFRTSSPNPDHG